MYQGLGRTRQTAWWVALLLLTGCAAQLPQPPVATAPVETRPEPVVRVPMVATPISRTPIQSAPPPAPAPIQRSHPRYAPPPAVASHWDNQLGVYVLEGGQLYYRERVYYRFDGGWFSAGRMQGPWEAISPFNVPAGLQERYR